MFGVQAHYSTVRWNLQVNVTNSGRQLCRNRRNGNMTNKQSTMFAMSAFFRAARQGDHSLAHWNSSKQTSGLHVAIDGHQLGGKIANPEVHHWERLRQQLPEGRHVVARYPHILGKIQEQHAWTSSKLAYPLTCLEIYHYISTKNITYWVSK